MATDQKSSSGAWLVVIAASLALWLGLRGKAPTSEAAPAAVTPAPVSVAPPKREPTLDEYLAALAPEKKIARARDFAALGLRRSVERPEAYSIGLKLLDSFPATHESAKEAKALRAELLARRALPTADQRRPTERELLTYLARIADELKAATDRVGAPLPVAAAQAQGFVAPRAVAPGPRQPAFPGGPTCAENGSCYGDVSSATGKPKTTHVNGYHRKDGTYVRGHYRSK